MTPVTLTPDTWRLMPEYDYDDDDDEDADDGSNGMGYMAVINVSFYEQYKTE